jgi:hypothetical protein
MIVNEEHEIGCPARYGDGDCDESPERRADIAREERDSERRAKDLDDRAEAVLSGLAERGYRVVDKLTPDDDRALALKRLGLTYGLDTPAGAGDDVEAFRG